jgi:NAD+ diphosphatase
MADPLMSPRSPAFDLLESPALSRTGVDRREPLRDDHERLLARWPEARVLRVDSRGRTLLAPGGRELVLAPAPQFGGSPPPGSVFLGADGAVDYWALRVPDERGADNDAAIWRGPDASGAAQWLDLRGAGALLGGTDAALFTTAVAVLNWHARGGFCARCGSPVVFRRAGWASFCERCDHEEYPRTDPAVICLVQDSDASHVVLARQPVWPPSRYSVLAGFVEAGESLESTVCREIAEEVGVAVRELRYLGSQPWPFPRSLMLGFSAVTERGAVIRPAYGEIADAAWFSREHVAAAVAAEGHEVEGLALPGGSSIAYGMLSAWVDAGREGH